MRTRWIFRSEITRTRHVVLMTAAEVAALTLLPGESIFPEE